MTRPVTSPMDRRLYILDTNVLLHDPSALFRFKEHDLHLPVIVLEELDQGKKGMTEIARNARQASRYLDDLIRGRSQAEINAGIPLFATGEGGRLHFQTEPAALPAALPRWSADNQLLASALHLQERHPERRVIIVSKDINLRIKAAVLGIHAEDYASDQVVEDLSTLYRGIDHLPPDFWESHAREMESWQEEGITWYRLRGPRVARWHPNQFLLLEGEQPFRARVERIEGDSAVIRLARDYTSPTHDVWGITARNPEQSFALELLMDPEVDFVSLSGTAGTGKTLLTLAAGLTQTLEHKRYQEIIMTRVTVPVGEDIGFLPGTEEEKMTPWMGALMDNLEVLTAGEGGAWGQAASRELLSSRIRVRSLNFMRGRTFLNRFIILDEAQNLTAKQMKTLVTRAGPGTKVVCLGNLAQIDTPYLTETSSGLSWVVERFRAWEHSGHITLQRGERSRLADFASTHL